MLLKNDTKSCALSDRMHRFGTSTGRRFRGQLFNPGLPEKMIIDRCRAICFAAVSLPPPRKICNCRCLSVCLSVSKFAQKLPNGFAWNFRKGWQWANEQIIKFWWWSGSRIQVQICIRISIATLVRCALVEVCIVPVLLVFFPAVTVIVIFAICIQSLKNFAAVAALYHCYFFYCAVLC